MAVKVTKKDEAEKMIVLLRTMFWTDAFLLRYAPFLKLKRRMA